MRKPCLRLRTERVFSPPPCVCKAITQKPAAQHRACQSQKDNAHKPQENGLSAEHAHQFDLPRWFLPAHDRGALPRLASIGHAFTERLRELHRVDALRCQPWHAGARVRLRWHQQPKLRHLRQQRLRSYS